MTPDGIGIGIGHDITDITDITEPDQRNMT